MKLNKKGFSDVITMTIIGGVLGALFITGAFVLQEIDKQNTLNNLYNQLSRAVKVDDKDEVKEEVARYTYNLDEDSLVFNLNSLTENDKESLFFWLRDDNKFIALRGKALYNQKFNDVEEVIIAVRSFKDFFEKQGFDINQVNNNPYGIVEGVKYITDPSIGFEKDNLKCLLYWNTSNFVDTIENPPLSLRCGYYTKESEEEFNTFYPVVAGEREFARITVEKIIGDFAKGSTSGWRGGSNWYASKQGGEWAVDEVTQDLGCLFDNIADNYPREFFTEKEWGFCDKIK